ncbi:MAG: hypothetical protein PVH56_02605 [Desulfobacterales bacterium]
MAKPNLNDSIAIHFYWIYAAIIGLAIISGAIYLLNFELQKFVPALANKTSIHVYVILFLFLCIVYFLGVLLVLKAGLKIERATHLVVIILFAGTLFRVCLVPTEPSVLSKDMYRYIWDGRVQQSGINPYLFPPAAQELKNLQDNRIYPNINRKNHPTIYPAGAQLFFRLVFAIVGDSVYGYKGFQVVIDILSMLLLVALLKVWGFGPARVIVYAWNPLVIFEIAYSGHLEGVVVFLMVAAFYLTSINKKIPGYILLAICSGIKLYPALLLPAMIRRKDRIKGILTFIITFSALYLPFVSAGNRIAGFLSTYLNNPYESFNWGLKNLIMRLFPGLDYSLLSHLFILALMAVGLVIFIKEKHGVQMIRYAYILVGFLIVLMPASLHPWYVILIIPFLTFFPSLAWLIFSATVTLSYLKYATDMGVMPTWVLFTEYLVLFALLILGYIFKHWISPKSMARRSPFHKTVKWLEVHK